MALLESLNGNGNGGGDGSNWEYADTDVLEHITSFDGTTAASTATDYLDDRCGWSVIRCGAGACEKNRDTRRHATNSPRETNASRNWKSNSGESTNSNHDWQHSKPIPEPLCN